MKTKTLQMTSMLLMVIFWLASLTLNAQIHFEGLYSEGEGGAAWDADGSGPEPYGNGHMDVYYYSASRDYVDPTFSSGAHMLDNMNGFPLFEQALLDNGYTAEQLTLKISLCNMGEDIMGIDWFTIGDKHYSNFYPVKVIFELDGKSLVEAIGNYTVYIVGPGTRRFETGYLKLNNISDFSPDSVKNVASEFLSDIGIEELKLIMQVTDAAVLTGNGRSGGYYDLNCTFQKGLPTFPLKGLHADNEGTASWNADGTGPEPYGNGHGDIAYYAASVDYGGINPDLNACLAHGIGDSDGFFNTLLQLQYRGLEVSDLKIKMGLCSLGPDVQGEDWGWENGQEWLNEYNGRMTVEINGEPILEVLLDTNKMVFINPDNMIFSAETSVGKVYNISENASQNAQFVAKSFLKDLGSHYLMMDVSNLSYVGSFSGNGRSGLYYELVEGKMIGIHETATFIPEGPISGIWTAENSPYYVDGNLSIENGKTLTINPGTKIAIRGPYHFEVQGRVIADGTNEDPILFTHSNPNVWWDGFDYNDTPPENEMSVFNWCVLSYAYAQGAAPRNSGGALEISNFDNIEITNSTFEFNKADISVPIWTPSGGAIAIFSSNPLIQNCVFRNNQATDAAAIIVYSDANPIISNCLFYNNQATSDAGAIEFNTNANGILINNTFADNHAKIGGALQLKTNSSPTLINSIFWGNEADESGSQVQIEEASSQPNFYYCNVQGGPDEFGGSTFSGEYQECIDEDPIFMEGEEYPLYYPSFDSPVLNAGTPDDSEWYLAEFLPELDLWGYPRNTFGRIDMGVYENFVVNVPESKTITNTSLTAYPNPFHHSTNLEFSLEKSSWIQIDVYNLIGEKVDVVYQAELPAGKHTLNWQNENLSDGVYFIRLQTSTNTSTYKILKN